MTPKERVEKVLRWKRSNRVPFTIYESKIPQCAAERAMRNRGLCIVNRRSVFKTHRPNVKTSQRSWTEDGKPYVETLHETPCGTLRSLHEPAGFTNWVRKKLFKGPEDYPALRFFLKDEVYEPDYEAFACAERDFGDDGIFRAGFGLEPLQHLQSGGLLDMEQFCLEWMDNRDEILKLYEILVANRRRIYRLVAESPASHANYGGNVTPFIVSPALYEQYYLPHYNEAAEIMHRYGKLIGCHYDAHCKLLAPSIAKADLDYIEAFTPAPDTDMTLGEARLAWPEKVLWLNFPSSEHLKPDAEVEAATFALLEQVREPDGILMGITEDMPPDRWRDSCTAILDGLERHACERPERYARSPVVFPLR